MWELLANELAALNPVIARESRQDRGELVGRHFELAAISEPANPIGGAPFSSQAARTPAKAGSTAGQDRSIGPSDSLESWAASFRPRSEIVNFPSFFVVSSMSRNPPAASSRVGPGVQLDETKKQLS